MASKISPIGKLSMILLLVSPILSIYGYDGGWDFAFIIISTISFFYFLLYNAKHHGFIGRKDPLPKGLSLYFAYYIFSILLFSKTVPVTYIQVYLYFVFFFATFNRTYFLKIYKIFAIICIVFFFLQELTYLTTGHRLVGVIPGLPVAIAKDAASFVSKLSTSDRSSSFFSEPAHFAQFLFPLLAIELFYDKSSKRFLFSSIIIVSLLLLRSGNALFGLIPLLLFEIPFILKKSRKFILISFVLFLVGVSGVGYYYVNSEIGASLMERQTEVDSELSNSGSNSGFLRIWRGYFVYDDYSVSEKIFGCPDSNVQLSHVASAGMLMAEDAELYFNAIQKIILNTGIVGLIIFLYIMYHILKNNNICGRAILTTMFFLFFISAIYLSYTMILYMTLAVSMKYESKYNKNR